LHVAAFDCCATVRFSIVAALAILHKQESLVVLEELTLQELESEWVRSAAQDAIRVVRGEITLADSAQVRHFAPPVTQAS
jgi:hypothetical protein